MKNIFRKSLSLIVIISILCLTSFNVGIAKKSTVDGECIISDYTTPTSAESARSYLKMLGIVDDLDLDAKVTRGQAVSIIVRAMGLEDVAMKAGSMYVYEEKMAYVAWQIGILSGSTYSEWDLDSHVTYEQLSKMLVVSLGYGAVITSPTAYPTEYMNYVSKLGLTKGTSLFGSDTVLMGDFLIMLSNTMEAEVLEIAGVYAEGVKLKVSKNKTLETLYLSVKNLAKRTGVVETDFYTSTIKNEKCEYSQIRIDGSIYACESEKYMGCVGMKVEFVYYDSKAQASRKIIGMRPDATNIVYEFPSGHNAYLKDCIFYYEINSKKEGKIHIASDAIYVVNNALLSSYDTNTIDYSGYSVKLIDNDDDDTCDVVFLTKSETVIVNYVKDDIIYLTYGTFKTKNVIDLSELDENEDALIVRDINGTPKSLSDVKEDMSISVIASDDFKYVEIIILPEEKTGKFVEYSAESEIVKINDEIYKFKISSNDFELGNTYNFRVNENNEIFYIESIMSDCSYIVDVSNISVGLSSGVKIKLYDNENGIQIFSTADKVNIDGSLCTDEDSIYSAIEKGTLAYVSLNSKNKIRKIEYLDEYGERAKRVYRKDASGFNDIDKAKSIPFKFDDTTVFFYIPESGSDSEFGNLISLKDEQEYTTRAYELNEDTNFVKAVVVEFDTDMRSDNYLTYKSDVGIVSSVRQTLDSENQGVYKVDGFIDGEAFTYTSGHYEDVFNLCATLKRGDVIRFITNYNNEIVRVQRIVSLEDTDEFFHDGKDTTDEQFFGQVITLNKSALTNFSKYLCHEMNVSTSLSYNNLVFMRFPASRINTKDSKSQFANYYIYDKKSKEVSIASVDDIITFKMAGEAASKVFVQRSKSIVQCIVIVKD